MKSRIILLGLVAFASGAFADSVTLKTGEKIEGTITNINADFVTIEVPYSATIIDQRMIARSDVEAIAQQSAESRTFEKLKVLQLPNTALDATAHAAIIQESLQPFIAEFPHSTNLPAIRQRLAAAEAELARLNEGDIKVGGRWLTPAQQEEEAYQVAAARLLVEMRREMARGQMGPALNNFQTLHANHKGAVAYVEALPLAKEAATKLEQQLNFKITNLPSTLAARQRSLELAGLQRRGQVEAALQRDDARATALAERARSQKQSFYEILPFDEKGLKDMQTAVRKILSELNTTSVAPLQRGVTLAARTISAIESDDLATAKTTVDELKKVWPAYEGTSRLEKTIADRQREVDEASKRQAEAIEKAAGAEDDTTTTSP